MRHARFWESSRFPAQKRKSETHYPGKFDGVNNACEKNHKFACLSFFVRVASSQVLTRKVPYVEHSNRIRIQHED